MDIDIDVKSNFDPKKVFPNAVLASMVQDGELIKHHVGVYFQTIPEDKMTGLAAIPYKEAEEAGYFKIDFLHLKALDCFESKDEIRALLKVEPQWDILQSPGMVKNKEIFQLHDHFDILEAVKPRSAEEIADCIALIRPGKRYLLDTYLKDKKAGRKELWKKTDKYYFKKSHAVAYASIIILQLHLIEAGIL